jgi:hypothetical protein
MHLHHIIYTGDVSGHVTGTVSTTSSSSSATGSSIGSGESASNGSENDNWALYEVTVNCNLLNHYFCETHNDIYDTVFAIHPIDGFCFYSMQHVFAVC